MSTTVMPTRIRIETSSFCQLRCPACPTTSGEIHPAVGSGFLKLSNFVKLLQENPQITDVELSNFGEIFLNPELLDIMAHAFERRVTLRADNGVNLNNVKEPVLDGLVRYRFNSLTCSIDGASNETYAMYRVRGNFDTVIENIRKINFYKQKHRSKYPLLTWQYVIFGHNEHEIPIARAMAHELDMRFYPKLSWDPEFSPVKDIEYVKKEVGASSREEYAQQEGLHYMQAVCNQLWDQPQINWDGKLLGCCYQYWGDFGANVFEDGLSESLNNETMSYAREMLLGKKPAREGIPCTTCNVYQTMKTNEKWLDRRSGTRILRNIRSAYQSLRPGS